MTALFTAALAGCSTSSPYAPGSIAAIEYQQARKLFTACSSKMFEDDMHKIYEASVIQSTCKDWSRGVVGAHRRALTAISESNGFVRD